MRCRGIRLRDRFVVRPPDAELAGGTGAWSLRGRCGRICRGGRQALSPNRPAAPAARREQRRKKKPASRNSPPRSKPIARLVAPGAAELDFAFETHGYYAELILPAPPEAKRRRRRRRGELRRPVAGPARLAQRPGRRGRPPLAAAPPGPRHAAGDAFVFRPCCSPTPGAAHQYRTPEECPRQTVATSGRPPRGPAGDAASACSELRGRGPVRRLHRGQPRAHALPRVPRPRPAHRLRGGGRCVQDGGRQSAEAGWHAVDQRRCRHRHGPAQLHPERAL